MLFRKKSRARLKADAKIKALKRENRDFARGMTKFAALAVLALLLMFGLPFVICLNLVYVFERPVMEAVLASVAAGMFVILRREPHRGEGDARLAEAPQGEAGGQKAGTASGLTARAVRRRR